MHICYIFVFSGFVSHYSHKQVNVNRLKLLYSYIPSYKQLCCGCYDFSMFYLGKGRLYFFIYSIWQWTSYSCRFLRPFRMYLQMKICENRVFWNRVFVIFAVQTHAVRYIEIEHYRFIPRSFYHAIILPSRTSLFLGSVSSVIK